MLLIHINKAIFILGGILIIDGAHTNTGNVSLTLGAIYLHLCNIRTGVHKW